MTTRQFIAHLRHPPCAEAHPFWRWFFVGYALMAIAAFEWMF